MAREILFRAKRTDNGEWVEGLLTVMWRKYHIIRTDDENTAYPIAPETVRQYTGLEDRNGRKIFDGDTVELILADKKIKRIKVSIRTELTEEGVEDAEN